MTCTEDPGFVDASKGGHQNQKKMSRNPLKKFHPTTPEKFVDKEENTATAKKAIVETKFKAAQLKIKALNVGSGSSGVSLENLSSIRTRALF